MGTAKHHRVFGKPLSAALAIFWMIWAGLIIPGHTRGIVPLTTNAPEGAGSAFEAALGGCCCGGGGVAKGGKGETAPEKKSGENCAICNFVAKLSAGMAFHTTLPPLGFLEFATPVSPGALEGSECFRMFLSRAPPIFSAC